MTIPRSSPDTADMDASERARAWAMIADKDAEVARVKAKNIELYRKISELATDAYDLTVRAEAAEDRLEALEKLHFEETKRSNAFEAEVDRLRGVAQSHSQRSELDEANNACLELAAKHGFATGHGDTVSDMIREFSGQIRDGGVAQAQRDAVIFERCATIAETFGIGRERASYGGSDIATRIRADAIDYCAVSSTDRCAKCGRETKGEAALVDGAIWCHPCADAAAATSKLRGDGS